jgi:hypothetical protein
MDQAPRPTDGTVEGIGDPAEERTVTEPPPAVNPELAERMHELQEEIAEDERAIPE